MADYDREYDVSMSAWKKEPEGKPAAEGGGQDGASETGQRQGYRLAAEYGRNPSGTESVYIISAETDFGSTAGKMRR
ncbi:MAG: hypothetical protein ACLUOI_39190 [Eisenbergiella sp.]